MPPGRLGQCFTLALLLHLLLVLVLGNTPGGTARPGEGVWGSLSVRLQGGEARDPRPGPPLPPAPPPPAERGPVGAAKSQRFGGVVRPEPAADRPAAPRQPGAARLGAWRERPGEQLEGETALPQPPAEPRPPAMASPGADTAPGPDPQPEPEPVYRPAPVPTLLERAPAPVPLTPSAIAAEPPLRAAPRPPAPRPAALERLAAPAPPTLETAGRLSQDLLSLAPPKTQELPQPTAVTRPSPTALPAVPGAESADVADSAKAAEPLSKLPNLEAPALAEPSPVPRPATPSALPLVPAPAPPLVGAPDAGSRLGHDVATPPSAAASAPPPRLNLSLPRGGEISSQGGRGLLQMLPHPPERKSKLSEGIENAARKDCREAHSDKGLLAAVPLLLDGARDKGCRW